jgi:hypothetical protein
MDLKFGELEELLSVMQACCNGTFHTPPVRMAEGVRSFEEYLSRTYLNRFSSSYNDNKVPKADLLELNKTYEMFRGYWKSTRGQELQPLIEPRVI